MSDDRRLEAPPAGLRAVAQRLAAWSTFLKWYLVAIAVGNVVWEFAQLPLYTIWRTGSTGEIIFAAVHCTGGDIVIATASVVLALVLAGTGSPTARLAHWRVGGLAVALGLPTRSSANGSTSSFARAGHTRSSCRSFPS